ncbi:hypothetical protein [Duganella rhizosphaerae]|uniref:hypothetical protein n=1 Tax=Duganella rhizosphaerae TaxID=2885763 RepID=UPI00403F163B
MDITPLTPQRGFTYAVSNKLPIQKAKLNPLQIKYLARNVLWQENILKIILVNMVCA